MTVPRRILLGVTGSIAAAHTPALVTALRVAWKAEVRCVLTAAATTFVAPKALAVLSGHPVLGVASDPTDPTVEHMVAAAWADLVLVLPATADLLAKAATGAAPDPLTTCLLAATAPVAFVPVMNPAMWAKPAVQRNVTTLRGDGCLVVPPAAGIAASDGAPGTGSMPPLPTVLAAVTDWLADQEARCA